MAAHSFINERARYRRRRWIGVFLSAAMLSTSSGCTILPGLQQSLDYSEECNEMMLDYRNQAAAAKAWLCRKHCYRDRCELDDFGDGFKAGYMEVASGGNPCTPAFAPREYWSWKYQSGCGQKRVAAWFAGFPMGVQAAEQDGVGHYAYVTASSEMRAMFNNGGYATPPAGACGPGAVDPAMTLGGIEFAPTDGTGAPIPAQIPAPIPAPVVPAAEAAKSDAAGTSDPGTPDPDSPSDFSPVKRAPVPPATEEDDLFANPGSSNPFTQ